MFLTILPPSQPPPPPPPSFALIGGRPGGPESRLFVVVLLFSALASMTKGCLRSGSLGDNVVRRDASWLVEQVDVACRMEDGYV
jgi:hypothetical protein